MSKKFLTPILLPGDPVAALEAAPKQYVDSKVGGGGGFNFTQNALPLTGTTGQTWYQPNTGRSYVYSGGDWTEFGARFKYNQDTAPATAFLRAGDTWYNTSTGDSFVWTSDGDSTQWVQFAPGSGGGGGGSGFTFVQELAPTPVKVGDTWFDLSTAATGGTSWVAVEEAPGGEKVWVQFAPGTAAPLPQMGGIWRRVANQALASGALVTISWDTEDVDTHGFLPVNTGTFQMPAGSDGIYTITCFIGGIGGNGGIEITGLAGSSVIGQSVTSIRTGWCTASVTLRLAAGNQFWINVWQNTGAASNAVGRIELWKVA